MRATTTQPGRASKLRPLESALNVVQDGTLLAVGGLWFHNNPAAAAREIARRPLANLRIVAAPPSSYAVDLLIGSGIVESATVGHVSFEHLGFAPNFRRAAQTGSVRIIDADEATILGGLMATLEHLTEHPVTSVRGTEIASSPIAHRAADGVVAPLAMRPDVCVLHAQEADIYGNIRYLGTPFCDPLLAKASRHVIVTVDRIIDNEIVRREPHRTTIPGYLVDSVVEAPYGAHPGSSQGVYTHDEGAIRDYIAAGAAWRTRYFEPYVLDAPDLSAYIEAVGGPARIEALSEMTR
jgi:glutaconate CoA-transferase subunit A